MPEVFVTADLHLGHGNVILHCNRNKWVYDNPDYKPNEKYNFKHNNPKAVHLKSHDEDLINNWNKIVGKKDEVWILGDFAWKNHIQYLLALNGTKFLVRGNHDKMNQDALKCFKRIDGTHHYHFSYYTQIMGRRVMMSHCPYSSWFSSCHGSWNLHGHCHGRHHEQPYMLQFDVGVDVWGYHPVPWCVIERKMAAKELMKMEYLAMSPKERIKNFELPEEGAESDIQIETVRYKNDQYLKAEGFNYEQGSTISV